MGVKETARIAQKGKKGQKGQEKQKKPKRYNKRGLVVRKSHTAERSPSRFKRHKLRFVSTGSQDGWKHITTVPLKRDRNVRLPRVITELVPPEIRDIEGGVPMLSFMLCRKLGVAVIFCRAVETDDRVVKFDDKLRFVREVPAPLDYGAK